MRCHVTQPPWQVFVMDERALVGSLLWLDVDKARHVRALFDRADLDDERHKVIVDLIDGLLADGVRPDPAALFVAARTLGTVPETQLGKFGAHLAELYGAVSHPQMAHVYAAGVVEAGVRRRITEAAVRLTQAAASNDLATTVTVTTSEIGALAVCIGRVRQETSA